MYHWNCVVHYSNEGRLRTYNKQNKILASPRGHLMACTDLQIPHLIGKIWHLAFWLSIPGRVGDPNGNIYVLAGIDFLSTLHCYIQTDDRVCHYLWCTAHSTSSYSKGSIIPCPHSWILFEKKTNQWLHYPRREDLGHCKTFYQYKTDHGKPAQHVEDNNLFFFP